MSWKSEGRRWAGSRVSISRLVRVAGRGGVAVGEICDIFFVLRDVEAYLTFKERYKS